MSIPLSASAEKEFKPIDGTTLLFDGPVPCGWCEPGDAVRLSEFGNWSCMCDGDEEGWHPCTYHMSHYLDGGVRVCGIETLKMHFEDNPAAHRYDLESAIELMGEWCTLEEIVYELKVKNE